MGKYLKRAFCYSRPVNGWESITITIPAMFCNLPKSHCRKGHYRIQNGRQVYVKPCIIREKK